VTGTTELRRLQHGNASCVSVYLGEYITSDVNIHEATGVFAQYRRLMSCIVYRMYMEEYSDNKSCKMTHNDGPVDPH